MFQREIFKTIEQRMREPRRFIQVLAGPRQTGKTTLVLQLEQSRKMPVMYVSADGISESGAVWIDQQWEAARLKHLNKPEKPFVLIIDEIQKVQNWSESVKKNWDADTRKKLNIRVILLGSAQLVLQKGLSESLAGRHELVPVTHWSFAEMKKAFGYTPEQYVWYGGYPGAAALTENERRWQDYVLHSLIETTVSKDILMLSRIDKPALLKRLFELGCSYSGQILSYTKITGQLQDAGNTTTLAHYLTLLDSAGLMTGIEKFSSEKVRQRLSSPKWMVQNSALFSAYTQKNFLQARTDPSFWGRCVETAVGAHLLNTCRKEGVKLYYWRDRNMEVDFVLEKNKKLIGLEVKSGRAQNLKGMQDFQKRMKPYKVLLVGDSGIHWKDFLNINPIELF